MNHLSLTLYLHLYLSHTHTHSGDIIGVTLDLDMETLSFSLNGKPLGVAVDGLTVSMHGPFYPAFSLYNDDDQVLYITLTIIFQTCLFILGAHFLQKKKEEKWSFCLANIFFLFIIFINLEMAML